MPFPHHPVGNGKLSGTERRFYELHENAKSDLPRRCPVVLRQNPPMGVVIRVPWLEGSTSALSASHPPGHLACQWRTCRVRHINLTIYVTAKEIRSNFSFFGNLTWENSKSVFENDMIFSSFKTLQLIFMKLSVLHLGVKISNFSWFTNLHLDLRGSLRLNSLITFPPLLIIKGPFSGTKS